MRSLAPPSQRTKALHEQYAQPIFNYCLRRLRSREEAEDAAQIVFLNAHRCLEEGVEPQSERAWLFKIAEHVVMYRWRTISRRARVEFPVDVDAIADLVVAPENDGEELQGLPDALARLPEGQQRAIVLREWYGLSYREVAAELGLSVSATETLIFRARCRLAQELGGPAPTQRRRTPLSLASPLASLKWLLGGGTTVKALVGVTSVAVLAVGSARIGLLPYPGASLAAPAVPRALVLPAVPASEQFTLARGHAQVVFRRSPVRKMRVSAPAPPAAAPAAAAPGRLVVAEDPAPAVEATTPAPVSEQAAPQEEASPAVAPDALVAVVAAAPVVDVTAPVAPPADPVVDSPPVVPVAAGPVDTPAPPPPPDPGQSGDAHGPNDNAAAGQAQRSENVPLIAADPGNDPASQGQDNSNNQNGNPTPGVPQGPPAHEPGPPQGQGPKGRGGDALDLGAAVPV